MVTGGKCTCKTCRYYDPDRPGASRGKCRRRAPRAGNGRWPRVNDTDWCGEFVFLVEDRECRT